MLFLFRFLFSEKPFFSLLEYLDTFIDSFDHRPTGTLPLENNLNVTRVEVLTVSVLEDDTLKVRVDLTPKRLLRNDVVLESCSVRRLDLRVTVL